MGWCVAEINPTNDVTGYVIYCNTTGGIVRPLRGRTQSVFDKLTTWAIASLLKEHFGDPRHDGCIDCEGLWLGDEANGAILVACDYDSRRAGDKIAAEWRKRGEWIDDKFAVRRR